VTNALFLSPWRAAELIERSEETPRGANLVFAVDGWPGHRAGQHVDLRRTGADGYQAQRSYSIASAPEPGVVTLTVERLDDGEVSPYLVDEMAPGDAAEIRGRSATGSYGPPAITSPCWRSRAASGSCR
jgi:ferredoxin-NADP reductase